MVEMWMVTTAFFAGLIWWELIILGLSCIFWGFSLNKESGLAFIILTAGTAIYFFGGIPQWIHIMYYVIIGLIWMVFKVHRLATQEIAYVRVHFDPPMSKSDLKDRIFRRLGADVVFFWLIAWPFSFFGFLVNDAIKWLYTKLKYVLSSMIESMLEKAGFVDEDRNE